MSINLWLYDISNPHSDFPDNVASMKMHDFSLTMRSKILASLLEKKTGDLIFSMMSNGKPCLENDNTLRFNVSHTGNIWGMAVTLNDTEIGFDIETRRSRKYMSKVMETYFHPEEFAHYKSLSNKQTQIDYFYELWTQKESYAKYLGQGLKYDFSADAFPAGVAKETSIVSGRVLSAQPKNQEAYLSLAYARQTKSLELTFLGDASLGVKITD